MGLLTDPNSGQGDLIKTIIKHNSKICTLLFITSIVWFCALAYAPLNNKTYFSENALLPGLVQSEFRDTNYAKTIYQELMDEMEKYDNNIPYPWLLAKFQQLGLDTYTHNFTLKYSLGRPQRFTGKNVYAILRAPRAASTESLVLSVPYRPPTSVHLPTAASIAIMLTFAKLASKEKYWSKDLIFLITEHEHLGMQAWLQAYHGIEPSPVLDHGDLKGRAGAIQAAINLELHGPSLESVDVKIEGLNGQLPNLDLFNLVCRMCDKEDVKNTFKNRVSRKMKNPFNHWSRSMKTMVSFLASQATGVPNGNHGLFYKYGIQALTLEGYPFKNARENRDDFPSMLRILEGIFRSLNNLLERFHQSFFFYILPSSDRFISIGLYSPVVGLLILCIFIKAAVKWRDYNYDPLLEALTDPAKSSQTKLTAPFDSEGFRLENWKRKFEEELKKDVSRNEFGHVGLVFLFAHVFGFLIKDLPEHLTKIGASFGYPTELSIYGGLALSCFLLTLWPLFLKRFSKDGVLLLAIISLLEFGTGLLCVSMYNFALGLFIGVIYVPVVLVTVPNNPEKVRFSFARKLVWILVHPFVLLNFVVFLNAFLTFPGEPTKEILKRGFGATEHALVFSIVDSLIYGNWLYSVVCVFLSNWLCFWVILFRVE